MGKEENKKEKEKLVLLVEDKLPPLLNILLGIQTMLFIANKQGLENAPKHKNTCIQVLHLVSGNKTGDPEHFDRFKRMLEEREQDENNIEKLEYKYQPLTWDANNYPANCEECAQIIGDKIEQICKGKDFSIVLDVILLEPVDNDNLADPEYKGHVLSQLLFERFRDHCIPYTNYSSGSKQIRRAWLEGTRSKDEPFQRECIVADAVYKPLRKKLYEQLRIREDTL